MMKRCTTIVASVVLLCAGCYRTRYSNLAPMLQPKPVQSQVGSRAAPSSWRHFFIYGWVPSEMVIDAAATCGGVEHVKRIETRQTFVQGLIGALAGYYINIYWPYTGAVVCDFNREEP